MQKTEVLQEYLRGLYEAYDALQEDYKNMHKRSKMHNSESVSDYYLRWRDRMRIEIRRVEALIMKSIHLPAGKAVPTVEKNRLQNVA